MPILSLTEPAMPHVGQTAPSFRGNDNQGGVHSLSQWRDRTTVLFFFCGCDICREVAARWGQVQSYESLGTSRNAQVIRRDQTVHNFRAPKPPGKVITVVVFAGGAKDVQALANSAHLDLRTTVLMPDLDGAITDDLYHVDECPRVFVIDLQQKIRYVNTSYDDAPKLGAAPVMITRILATIRSMP